LFFEKSLKKKKREKKKEITVGKIYSPIGNLDERAKLDMYDKALRITSSVQ